MARKRTSRTDERAPGKGACAACALPVGGGLRDYCPDCERHYCRNHYPVGWHRWAAGVDAESWVATCPEGHLQILPEPQG